MKAVLFANGQITDYDYTRRIIEDFDFFIACDGGVRHTAALGIVPDCIIGDMDSAPPDLLKDYKTQGVPIMRYAAEKDQTDLELGMSFALTQQPTEILLLGATGGRVDHMLANAQVLLMALKEDVPAILRDANSCIQITNHFCRIYKTNFETVSLIPLTTTVTGILTEGLQYPLRDEMLTIGSTRGISNRIMGDEATITLKEGLLYIIQIRTDAV